MKMTDAEWNQRYATNDLPWDTGRHDRNLEHLLTARGIKPCAILELGCGTGSNAVWLAARGFRVTALDISALAIKRARDRGSAAGVSVNFRVGDVLRDEIPEAPFALVFDRGCFHSFSDPGDRPVFASRVAGWLAPGGLWLSLLGSKDGPARDPGPPRWAAGEIVQVVEPRFEILSLSAALFDSDQPDPLKGWACLMCRRSGGGTAHG